MLKNIELPDKLELYENNVKNSTIEEKIEDMDFYFKVFLNNLKCVF